MRRREFLGVLCGAAAWPVAAPAQQTGRMRRIGLLMSVPENDPQGQTRIAAFREGLQKLGWMESRNIRIDYRWDGSDAELRQRAAMELIALKPEVVLTAGTTPTASVLKQTSTIPAIFVNVSDPIGSGFVASLSRPGGNVTGFMNFEASMAGKWLELLKQIAPHVVKVVFLFNPTTAPYAESYLSTFRTAALSFGVKTMAAPVRSVAEIEAAVEKQAQEQNGGIIVMPDGFMSAKRVEVTSSIAQHRLPAVYPYRFFTDIGGLLSYGIDQLDEYRRAATYVDKILNGAKPSNLPVQLPVKFELIINLRTAKTLGLDVPLSLQQRADEVIE